MEVFVRFCVIGVAYLICVFLLNYVRNFKILRKERKEMSENGPKWYFFDDFSLYDESITASSVHSLLASAPMTGRIASFNGNFITLFYHEVMWNDWHIC